MTNKDYKEELIRLMAEKGIEIKKWGHLYEVVEQNYKKVIKVKND